MFYFVRSPWWLRKAFNGRTWEIPGKDKLIYLSFDDGPHPVATSFVLDELKKYNAKATFFCIGKNVIAEPSIYKRILEEGHRVGNHTHNHLNGWKTDDSVFLENIGLAKQYIDSDLFRPPYGRITGFQQKQLQGKKFQLRTIMWTVLSGDFDPSISPEKCARNVIKNTSNGSIVVFHDSEKAFSKLQYVLPVVLDHFSAKGYRFEVIV